MSLHYQPPPHTPDQQRQKETKIGKTEFYLHVKQFDIVNSAFEKRKKQFCKIAFFKKQITQVTMKRVITLKVNTLL